MAEVMECEFKIRYDKGSLLDQTLVRLLKLLLGQSVYFLVKFSFSKNPAMSVYKEPYPPYLIILDILSSSSTISQVMSDHPGLSSPRILLGRFDQNPCTPDVFSAIFHSMTPFCLLAINSYLPMLCIKLNPVYTEVSFSLL